MGLGNELQSSGVEMMRKSTGGGGGGTDGQILPQSDCTDKEPLSRNSSHSSMGRYAYVLDRHHLSN